MSGTVGKPQLESRSLLPSRTASSGRGLSIPVLVGTIVALMILLPGLYLWRSHQVEVGAEAYVRRAEALAKQEQWAQSAESYFLFLQLRPDDVRARIQLAEAYEHIATRRPQLQRAAELYYEALAKAPVNKQHALRLRLAELLVESDNFASAEVEARKLLDSDPADARANRVLALALYGQARSGELANDAKARTAVGSIVEKAFQLNPTDPQLALLLAGVYRAEPQLQSTAVSQLGDAERARLADECLEQLVRSAPDRAATFLALYQYRQINNLPAADEAINRAMEMAPSDPAVLLTAADHAARRSADRNSTPAESRAEMLERAAQLYEQVIHAVPKGERAYLGLGNVRAAQNQVEQAIVAWELGLEQCGQNSIGLNMRLAETLIARGMFGQAEKCIASLESTAAGLRQQGVLEPQLGFARAAEVLRARLLIGQHQSAQAIDLLRGIASGRRTRVDEKRVVYQALLLLGNLYAAQGETQSAISSFDDAASLWPDTPEPHLAAAAVWMNIGRPEQATIHLKNAVAVEHTLANAVLLAGACLRSQARLPVAQRDFTEFESAINAAQQIEASPGDDNRWKLQLLQAEYAFLKQQGKANHDTAIGASIPALRAAEESAADSLAGMATVAVAYEQIGDRNAADRVLEKLLQQFTNAPEAYLAAAELHASRQDFNAAHADLDLGLTKVPSERRQPLQLGLVGLLGQQGRREEAWTTLSELHRQDSANRNLTQHLLELSIDIGKWADAEQLESAFCRLPDVDPVDCQYYKLRRLLGQANSADDQRLGQAEQLLAEMRTKRPGWAGSQVLLGQLYARQGKLELAVEAYQQAIRLGAQQVAVYEQLVLLLYQLNRLGEVEAYLTDLRGRSADSIGLSSLEITLALKAGQTTRALDLARSAVASRPNDPLAHIWLAQLLLTNDKPDEALAALQRAQELSPSDPRVYGALVNYFIRTKQLDHARATLEEFSTQINVPEVERELLRAGGYQLIGDHDRALTHVREAVRLDPNNPKVHERLAAILLATDVDAAEKALRRALELDHDSVTVRQSLAALLADRGGTQRWHEAVTLLDEAGPTAAGQSLDRQLQAVLYARRGGPDNLAQAEKLLASLLANPQTATPQNRLLLAQVLDAQGQTKRARQEYLQLADHPQATPQHIEAYLDWLLRHDAVEPASPWLDKLDKLAPTSTATMALRVRWMDQSRKRDQIEPYLERMGTQLLSSSAAASVSRDEELRVCQVIGDLLVTARQSAAAERWYRRAFELDPAQYDRLARSLAEQERIEEAVELCLAAADHDPSYRPATVLARTLGLTYPRAPGAERAEPLLQQALAAYADVPELLGAVADLRLVQERLEEACQLYRRIVDLQPNNVQALNNLALALAEQPSHETEALQFLDRAIEITGDQPNLLDSKGSVLLALGRVREAIALFSAAVSAANPDPRFYFHLALGHYRAGDLVRAREALAVAQNRQLGQLPLTASDSRLLAELNTQLQ